MSAQTAHVVSISRDTHTVEFVYPPDRPDRGRVMAEWGGYGVFSSSRGGFNVSWSAEVVREEFHTDDEFPLSMPHTIANMTVRALEDGEISSYEPPFDKVYLDHLFVQDEARGRGYGTLLWDIYVAIGVAVGERMTGKIGETTSGSTRAFLQSRGVPDADIESTSGAWMSSDAVRWDTPVENLLAEAPVRQTTRLVEYDD